METGRSCFIRAASMPSGASGGTPIARFPRKDVDDSHTAYGSRYPVVGIDLLHRLPGPAAAWYGQVSIHDRAAEGRAIPPPPAGRLRQERRQAPPRHRPQVAAGDDLPRHEAI